ncbi:MAG: M1 family aminopeptidase [Bacteroidales bacterium]|nr:M1 family aminopeptidase [Bacteroidales bacterium]
MRIPRILTAFAALLSIFASCSRAFESGVPHSLALSRKAEITDVRYELDFDIPQEISKSIPASETVCFNLESRKDVVLDARGYEISSVSINGNSVDAKIENEHIVLPSKLLKKGENKVDISFTAGEQSLNRREHFLYTLLVPDRARTLFPCFDQPDMKARYTLSLTVPEGWVAVSNTAVSSHEGNRICFAQTEPLSSYLFSFVAGEFECVSEDGISAAGKPVHLYHRETDPEKIAECSEVLRLVKSSLDWLEEYTGIPYPFAKYDLIVLPDFQYGGMEHTGATLYNDRRIFLNSNATTAELLDRAALIAHETAHMWFGDYVTMKWFDDVWTKEVFANFFAAKMARPEFPEINHELGDLMNYYAASYSEDRTLGSNAIQRPLDNLNYAGLIYCNIIYDKSPVVMAMLEKRLGEEKFRRGIQEYLRKFGYGNATWDDLIEIFSKEADFDIADWSRVWIKEKGMPTYDFEISGRKLAIRQGDPFKAGNVWQQEIVCRIVGEKDHVDVTAVFDGKDVVGFEAPFEIVSVIPNIDGKAYGWFRTDEESARELKRQYSTMESETARMSLLMTLYENVWHRTIDSAEFAEWVCYALDHETNSLIRSQLLSYGSAAARWAENSGSFETMLFSIAADEERDSEFRLLAYRSLMSLSTRYNDLLFFNWVSQDPFNGLSFSESDYTSLAYQLMIRYPEGAEDIRKIQADRITNPDRKEAFMYISQACSADQEERDRFFETLLHDETRAAESRVTSALSLLNHPLRAAEAVKYITPGLEALEEIQRTGDIFFPSTWCSALLSGHKSDEARKEVRNFVEKHESDMNPLLMTKVLQKGGWLLD